MGVLRCLLAVAMLLLTCAALRAEVNACAGGKSITTEKDAIDHAKQLFVKRQKLIRRIGGRGIDAITRNLSGDCCEATKDGRGWHVDLMDRRENPRTVFSFSFDECGKAVESRHGDK